MHPRLVRDHVTREPIAGLVTLLLVGGYLTALLMMTYVPGVPWTVTLVMAGLTLVAGIGIPLSFGLLGRHLGTVLERFAFRRAFKRS